MFLLWISPSAGPHDSFSTGILKGPNTPLPRTFPHPRFLFPWAQTPTAGLSQPAVNVRNSGMKTQQREGMRLIWNLHSFGVEPHSVSCPLVVTGGGGTSLSRCFYGYWGVDPLDDTLRDVNTPLGWGKVIKRADNFSLYELHYFHWLSGKKVKREQPPSPPFAASLPRHTPCFLSFFSMFLQCFTEDSFLVIGFLAGLW